MRNMLYIIWGSLCLLLVISGCKSTDGAKAPVSLTWKMGAVEVQPGYYENSFVLKNISDVPLGKDWIIYYSQLPREIHGGMRILLPAMPFSSIGIWTVLLTMWESLSAPMAAVFIPWREIPAMPAKSRVMT